MARRSEHVRGPGSSTAIYNELAAGDEDGEEDSSAAGPIVVVILLLFSRNRSSDLTTPCHLFTSTSFSALFAVRMIARPCSSAAPRASPLLPIAAELNSLANSLSSR